MITTVRAWRRLTIALLSMVLLLIVLPVRAAGGSRYFPETGFIVEGGLLSAFDRYGGVSLIGLPISDAMATMCEQHPCTVQWFERSRIELHHDDGQAYRGRIGADFLAARGTPWQFGAGSGATGCRVFPETGHTLCNAFLDGWQRYGVERLGLPISPSQDETYLDAGSGQSVTYRTQWFERAALEDHGVQGIMLRLLGSQTYPTWAEHLLADLINAERTQAHLPALAWDDRLAQAARGHSLDLARHNGRGHIGSDGHNPIERTQSLGLAGFFGGEIVTYDQSPVAAVQSFLHSPEHKDILLYANTTQLGVGYEVVLGSVRGQQWPATVWTVDFWVAE